MSGRELFVKIVSLCSVAILFLLLFFAVAVVLIFGVGSCVGQPLPEIKFTEAPYSHTGFATSGCVYSGQTCVHVQQWGAYALNVVTGGFKMVSPIDKGGQCVQAPKFIVAGDCHQSGVTVAASPGAEKWVVVTGAPNDQCNPDHGQFQILRLDGASGLRWVGEAFAPAVGRVNTAPSIDGDFAYAVEGNGQTFTRVDLNTLAVTSGLGSRPPWVPQPNVGGYTYAITVDPGFPQVCGAPQHFIATRSGSTPPPTPPPTPTPGGNPFATYIEALARAGVTAGCGGGNFCPERTMTRQEMATWLVLAINHGGPMPLLACQGTFNDVPCGSAP
ncbi:MAG TPA: S-layer homology domain-containing protein [Thermoanaerobaculia bacterium]|nr:S-layer homology domain-containing protein [Thermoanaerobaculia bacterium]